MVRTNIELDEKLVNEAMRLTHKKTKTTSAWRQRIGLLGCRLGFSRLEVGLEFCTSGSIIGMYPSPY